MLVNIAFLRIYFQTLHRTLPKYEVNLKKFCAGGKLLLIKLTPLRCYYVNVYGWNIIDSDNDWLGHTSLMIHQTYVDCGD